MSRILKVGAAQLGPIARNEPRSSAVARMIALMEQAKAEKPDLICLDITMPEMDGIDVLKAIDIERNFASQKLFFRRVRVPTLVGVYWNRIFINHSTRKLLRHFVADPEASVQQAHGGLGKLERMEAIAEDLGRDGARLTAGLDLTHRPQPADRSDGLDHQADDVGHPANGTDRTGRLQAGIVFGKV